MASLLEAIFRFIDWVLLPLLAFGIGSALTYAFALSRERERLTRLTRGIKVPEEWKTGPIDAPLNGAAFSKEEMSLSALIVRGETGHGSGVCISSSGLVLTNAHVVGDSKILEVEDEGNSYLGVVVKVDMERDAAVIVVGSTKLPIAAVALEPVRVGDDVFVAGAPLHLENRGMLTKGVVSKVGAFKGSEFIHMDAPIAPGNSGGPVFNASGELVGISVAIQIGADGGLSHIGLAIPLAEFFESMQIRNGLVEAKSV
jgi:S1-C subfamily serine protease